MDAAAQAASGGRKRRADGEVVWSWRRDAGVKPAGSDLAGNGDKNPLTGESTK